MPSPDDYDYAAVATACERSARLCHVAGNAGLPDVINATGMIRTMEQVMVDPHHPMTRPFALRWRKSMILLEVTRRTIERVGVALTCCGWARSWERNPVR